MNQMYTIQSVSIEAALRSSTNIEQMTTTISLPVHKIDCALYIVTCDGANPLGSGVNTEMCLDMR